MRIGLIMALALAASTAGAGRAEAQDFVVVAHAGVPVTAVSAKDLSDMFLKKKAAWSDGTKVVPVDQDGAAPARAAFSEAVHGRSVSAIQAHWQQQIFSGKDVPPADRKGDPAVLEFVRSTPGAVGYVAAGTATGSGVKVLTVN